MPDAMQIRMCGCAQVLAGIDNQDVAVSALACSNPCWCFCLACVFHAHQMLDAYNRHDILACRVAAK